MPSQQKSKANQSRIGTHYVAVNKSVAALREAFFGCASEGEKDPEKLKEASEKVFGSGSKKKGKGEGQ
eukprot:3244730-Pleurochrysis_carterae.AAC.1